MFKAADMKRILICKDNAMTAQLFRAALKTGPYVIHVLESATSIIEDTVAFSPDLILMDLRIPGVSGEQAIQLLRADDNTKAIPILLHSANAQIETIAEELGVGFVGKPFSIKQFREGIREACGLDPQVVS